MVSVSTVNTHASLKHIIKTEREMLQAMERISSGKRINNAGDDAAGAAIPAATSPNASWIRAV